MRTKWMIAVLIGAGGAWAVPQITSAQQWIVPGKTQRKSRPYPVYMPSTQPGVPAPTAPVAVESGFRAVRFTGDEKADTATLNDLAAKGWEYVGPLANGTVAFKHRLDAKPAASELEGTWAKVSGEETGVVTAVGDEPGTFVIAGNRWAYKSGDKVLQAGTRR